MVNLLTLLPLNGVDFKVILIHLISLAGMNREGLKEEKI